MSATPLSVVKERFQSKDKLVEAVEKLATPELWLGRVNDVKGLKRASNRKLVRLHNLLEDAKKRFGSRDKLIQSIAELAERPKDKDWAASLGNRPLPELLDLHQSLDRAKRRRAASGETVEKKPKKEKKPMVKKPSAKAAAAPAPAPKAEAPKAAPAKAEAKKAEPKAEPKKAEAKSKPSASKPSASKPAASKEPVAKKAPAAKKTPAKKA